MSNQKVRKIFYVILVPLDRTVDYAKESSVLLDQINRIERAKGHDLIHSGLQYRFRPEIFSFIAP